MILFLLYLQVQPEDIFSQTRVLEFADYLYMHGDYSAALGEYRRYRFLNDSVSEDICEKIIDCLVQLARFDEALEESSNLATGMKRDYTKGWIYFLAGAYDSSRTYLTHIGVPYKDNAAEILGLGYAFEYRFEKAAEYIAVPDTYPRYKKPLLGALYALFPGGGHFYCGRIGDGIFSFGAVSICGLLSYYYHHRSEDVKFGIALGTAILLYAGNIYGGINAVRNYNYYQNERYLHRILDRVKE